MSFLAKILQPLKNIGGKIVAFVAPNFDSSTEFGRILKNADIKRKALFTLGMVVVFRLLAAVPVPGVDPQSYETTFANIGFVSIPERVVAPTNVKGFKPICTERALGPVSSIISIL